MAHGPIRSAEQDAAGVGDRVVIEPSSLNAKGVYKLLIGSVIPRPIAWVSTVSSRGINNLAPFSFFTVASVEPPMLSVTFVRRKQQEMTPDKDTLVNVKDTGEFVVNIVPGELAVQMAQSSLPYEHEIDEFDRAGLTPAPCDIVQAPRVAEAPISMECRLQELLRPGADTIAFGEVLRFHFREGLLLPNGRVDVEGVDAVARLAGNYSSIAAPYSIDLDSEPPQIRREREGTKNG